MMLVIIQIMYHEGKVKSLIRVQLFVTPWAVAFQAPLSMGFSRQQDWSGLPFPSPGCLPNPEIKTGSPALQADSVPTEPAIQYIYMVAQMVRDLVLF